MYRGQDIGDRNQLTENCLRILESGQIKSLYSVLPHLGVLRSPSFMPPLFGLLQKGSRSQQLYAAVALGAIGEPVAVEPLRALFQKKETFSGPGTRSLQTAAIFALGEIGCEDCVPALLEIFEIERPKNRFNLGRKRIVITALGALAQNGNTNAERELLRLSRSRTARLRAQAMTELGLTYWSAAEKVPEDVLDVLIEATGDRSKLVQRAAVTALQNLGDLGNPRARKFLSKAD